MLAALLAVSLLSLLLSIVLLIVMLKRSAGTVVDPDTLKNELALRERAQLDALERARGSLDEAQRRAGQLQADAQREAATQIVAQLRAASEETKTAIADRFAAAQQGITTSLGDARRAQDERLDKVEGALKQFSDTTQRTGTEQREALLKSMTEIQKHVAERLETLQKENAAQLDRIRGTVEEKLQTTLETRLTESFKLVTSQLEQVARGLGEMQQLASGVGDLKRVLTNVRTRGTFGEVQLAALLEQVLTPQQYACNVATLPGSSERVEFAIRLPGRDGDGSTIWLPIDAKFPQEDYLRLQQAYETGDLEGVETARGGLRVRILGEAHRICSKYIGPPHTTDFALLFLPTEGLYAEVLRIPGLAEDIQRECRVVISGPTNLYALLNSLQMGFRTLAIEKRSSEVWKILGAVKTEFDRFGKTIGDVGKKLQEASNKVSQVETRARAMHRQLKHVEALPATEAAPLLPDDSEEDVPAEE